MESLATLEKQHREQSAWLKTCRREPIGGPHDGESFNDSTLAAFRERVLMLGAAGYRYPADLIGVIDAEIAERGGQ